MTPNPDPKAFTRASTFSKVIAAFRKATGLSVKDGKLMTLHDGSHVIDFNGSKLAHPFYATGARGTIRLNKGFVTYAGRTYYFPSATYSGISPGGVFLKIETHYTASFVAEGEPWLVTPVGSTPELVWRPANALGNYCQLTQLNDPDDPNDDEYAIGVGSSQTLYIPIAGESDGQVLNFRTQNIFLMPTSYGPLDYYYGWG
jgi:hypothetical protein